MVRMFSAFTERKRMIGSPKKKRQHKHSPKYNDAIRKYKKSRERVPLPARATRPSK